MILKIILNFLFYDQKSSHLPELVINKFMLPPKFRITYFQVICKYLHTEKYGGVLGYTIYDSRRNNP